MEEELKGNSYKSRIGQEPIPEKKVEKVISGAVTTKKSRGKGLKSILVSEDAGKVKEYVLLDVLIPALKKAIHDVITNGIDIILYGQAGVTKNRSTASRISYASYYDRESPSRVREEPRAKLGYDYNDVVLENRGDAEDVLSRLEELIDVYGIASVADLYDLVGLSGNFTDNKYGWKDLRNAQVVRVSNGYLLKMPVARPLN